MADLKYHRLSESVTGYDKTALLAIFGTEDNPAMPKTELLRTIIMNQLHFPTATETRSLRGFWYNPIKPILSMLGYLRKRNEKDDPGRRMSQDLSDTLGEMVKAGILRYADLKIEDNSRQLQTPYSGACNSAPGVYISGFAERGKIYPNIILAIEKDTEYETVRNVAAVLGCSVISGSGHPALSAMEKLLRSSLKDIGDQDIHIRALTDYDPTGYSIAQDFVDHASFTMFNLNMPGTVRYDRIGIRPEHFAPGELDTAKYEIVTSKRKQLSAWMNETGGIDGEPFGLELDALPRSTIREMFVTGCEGLIDKNDIIADDSRRAFVADIVAEAIKPRVLEISDQVFEKYKNSIDRTGVDLFDFARAGACYLPTDDLFKTDREAEIRAEALALLNGEHIL